MITTALFLVSMLAVFASFTLTSGWARQRSGVFDALLHLMFCCLVGLSVWTVSAYLLWGLGVELSIGTIRNGKMGDVWWYPPLVLAWTVVTFFAARPKTPSKENS